MTFVLFVFGMCKRLFDDVKVECMLHNDRSLLHQLHVSR